MTTQLANLYDEAAIFLYRHDLKTRDKAHAQGAYYSLKDSAKRGVPLSKAYKEALDPLLTSDKPVDLNLKPKVEPTYTQLNLTRVPAHYDSDGKMTVDARALNHPQQYVQQAPYEADPESLADKVSETIYDKVIGATLITKQKAYQTAIELEQEGYWWKDIQRGFLSATFYMDDDLKPNDYPDVASKIIRKTQPMAFQAYAHTVSKIPYGQKPLTLDNNNFFIRILNKRTGDGSMKWDEQLICPKCHHRSLIQPGVKTYHDIKGNPDIPPVCLHCGFEYAFAGFNSRNVTALAH